MAKDQVQGPVPDLGSRSRFRVQSLFQVQAQVKVLTLDLGLGAATGFKPSARP